MKFIADARVFAFVSLLFSSFALVHVQQNEAVTYRVVPGDTLSGIVARMPNDLGSAEQIMGRVLNLNPEAFVDGNINALKAGVLLRLPSAVTQVVNASVDVPSVTDRDTVPTQFNKDGLRQGRPDLQFGEIKASPIPGVYEVAVVRGPTLYVSADGKHFIAGDLYGVEPGKFVNLQEKAREGKRKQLMAAINKDEQIIFPATGETKAYLNVFTDVDCGYCQKLHQEIAQINAKGIEVRYLAYPRAGVESQSGQKLATAWCADDPQATLTQLKNRETVPIAVCSDNPVAKHYELGSLMGVTGTPNMVTESGELIGGYLPADELARYLGIEAPPIPAAAD